MRASSIPTRTVGFVEQESFGFLLADALELVPDCTWPLNIPVFAGMRRDAQISAVLDAYGLLIRRATWTVDPAGCDPEVARRVADDLGLPVVGEDEPGAARVKGVSWREHLRAALQSLVFGHYGFEMEADTSSGKARLSGLWERQPWSISQIHVDPKTGLLRGVSQDGIRKVENPQINADRLVWYTYEREGANWAGTSLLRPAYGPALLKKEMTRVLAIQSRRFGAGVPVIEWDASANPSPAQMAEAQRLSSAYRAGDQSGATVPPGARLVLKGLEGSAPATLDFIRWLDSQISGMALARFMDLGDSANGSRALGEAFTDFFTLAVQAAADDLADQATRQIAARLVAWNEGENEPVPAIKVADVGSRREVTAEALQSLLSSGGLAADPALEAWIRREWRLPEREGMAQPKVTAPGVDLPDKQNGDEQEPSGPGQPPDEADPDDLPEPVTARMADLDWGLFGRASDAQPEPQQLDLFDQEDDVDLGAFAPA